MEAAAIRFLYDSSRVLGTQTPEEVSGTSHLLPPLLTFTRALFIPGPEVYEYRAVCDRVCGFVRAIDVTVSFYMFSMVRTTCV